MHVLGRLQGGCVVGLRARAFLLVAPAHASAVALRCATRGYSDANRGAPQSHTVTAADLHAALRTLHLSESCTDAEVKRAFQAFAMLNHPDMKASALASSSSSSRTAADATPDGGAEAMRRGTEAYHLLRGVPFEARQRIFQEERCGRSGGGSRFRGPHDNFNFTAEEYAKAQRVYQGDRNRRRQRSSGGGGAIDDEDLFDLNTEEGRRRAARFEQVKARIHEMRRVGRRDDLPPWRVEDQAGPSTAAFNTGASAQDQQQRKDNDGKGPGQPLRHPERLGLHFFQSTISNLRHVRDLYRSRPGFAGMDGSAYDNPASAARVAAELSANPHLRQYILMKQRAQEKAIVDHAVRQPLLLFLTLVCGFVLVLVGVRVSQLYSTRARQDEELRAREEERGGG